MIDEIFDFFLVCVSPTGYEAFLGFFELLFLDFSEREVPRQLGQRRLLFIHGLANHCSRLLINNSLRYISESSEAVLLVKKALLPAAISANNFIKIFLVCEDAYVARWDVLHEEHII
jgi:hypothetical protein